MKRKIVTTLAMSLDGFIADDAGGYSWIVGDGDSSLNTETKWDFARFLDSVDTVVMGRICYDQQMHKEFNTKKVFIASSKKQVNHDNLNFISGDIVAIITEELKKTGKDIYIFGGGILLDSFIKSNIIDEYIIGVVPVILGAGKPLFLGNNPNIELVLNKYSIEEGITILHYTKRK